MVAPKRIAPKLKYGRNSKREQAAPPRSTMALSKLSFIGSNSRGQCIFPAARDIAVPAAAPRDWLSDGELVLKTVAGSEFTLLLADDNQLFAVGKNDSGQLGRGHSNDGDPDNRVPRPVTGFGLERITLVAAGYAHCEEQVVVREQQCEVIAHRCL